MPSIIRATTTSGLQVAPDNSGSLQLQTNGTTTAVTIDTSQNVGIGTSSPTSKLDINSSSTASFYRTLNIFNSAANSTVALDNQLLRIASNASGADTTINFTDSVTHNAWITMRASNLIFSNGAAAERMRIDSSGNVQIATTSQSNGAVLTVAGTVSASLNGRIYSLGTYNNTTASGANMHIALDGHMFRSTSSIKYKTDIQDTTHGLDKVMELRSVTYKGINDGDTVFGGLIAEEVHEAGLTEFVQYAEDGSPDALAYGQMVSLAFKAIQEQQTIINDLKTRIETLEAK
jgi:hypothetical protein